MVVCKASQQSALGTVYPHDDGKHSSGSECAEYAAGDGLWRTQSSRAKYC